ncbi:hypothetical protein ACHAPU_009358 [Fusarium lateritium]
MDGESRTFAPRPEPPEKLYKLPFIRTIPPLLPYSFITVACVFEAKCLVHYSPLRFLSRIRASQMLSQETCWPYALKNTCKGTVQLENGETLTGNISEGSIGYLIRKEDDMSYIQLRRDNGKMGACRVPHDVLEIGVAHCQAQIQLPPPLQELVSGRLEWDRYRVITEDKRAMLIYRCQSSVCQLLENKNSSMGMRIQFLGESHGTTGQPQDRLYVRHRLEGLPGIRVGLPLVISFEVMEDGKPHPIPWCRHPFHGAWSNSGELHSFCLKVEWMDEATQKWYTTTLQHTQLIGTLPNAPVTATPSWRKATTILQILLNRRYQNPPPWLCKEFPQVIRQVEYDHLNQVISFSDIPETVLAPPTHVSFTDNFKELFKAAQKEWKPMRVGPKPPLEWFYRPGTGKKDTGCVPCVVGHYMMKSSVTTGCSNRGEGFEVSPGEPEAAKIHNLSCYLCWTYWRRPCTWLPPRFGIEEGQEYDPRNYQLPRDFTGLAIAPYRKPQAIEIAPPMSLDEYYTIAQEAEIAPDDLTVEGGED